MRNYIKEHNIADDDHINELINKALDKYKEEQKPKDTVQMNMHSKATQDNSDLEEAIKYKKEQAYT